MRTTPFFASYMYGRRRLTRLEGTLYGIVGALLIALFAERMLAYMELAEKTAVLATISTLTSAVNARVVLDMARASPPPAGRWAGRNPFELTGTWKEPMRILGADPVSSIDRAVWTYDGERGEIIYRPRLYRGLRTTDPDGALRFRLTAQSHGLGYRLVSTSSYEWEPME